MVDTANHESKVNKLYELVDDTTPVWMEVLLVLRVRVRGDPRQHLLPYH